MLQGWDLNSRDTRDMKNNKDVVHKCRPSRTNAAVRVYTPWAGQGRALRNRRPGQKAGPAPGGAHNAGAPLPPLPAGPPPPPGAPRPPPLAAGTRPPSRGRGRGERAGMGSPWDAHGLVGAGGLFDALHARMRREMAALANHLDAMAGLQELLAGPSPPPARRHPAVRGAWLAFWLRTLLP